MIEWLAPVAVTILVNAVLLVYVFTKMKSLTEQNKETNDDQEVRLKEVEGDNAEFKVHIREAPNVKATLRSVDLGINTLNAEMKQRKEDDNKILESLTANNAVLGDMNARTVRLETLITNNGKH